METLPSDLKIEILVHLEYSELWKLRILNKYYQKLIESEKIWEVKTSKELSLPQKKFRTCDKYIWFDYIKRLCKYNKITDDTSIYLEPEFCYKEAVRTNNLKLLGQLLENENHIEKTDLLRMIYGSGNLEALYTVAEYGIFNILSWSILKASGYDLDRYIAKIPQEMREEYVNHINDHINFIDGSDGSLDLCETSIAMILKSQCRDYQELENKLREIGFDDNLVELKLIEVLIFFRENRLIYKKNINWDSYHNYYTIIYPIIMRDDLDLFKFILDGLTDKDNAIFCYLYFLNWDSKICSYIMENYKLQDIFQCSKFQDLRLWNHTLKQTDNEILEDYLIENFIEGEKIKGSLIKYLKVQNKLKKRKRSDGEDT